jgi:streptomycin 6-kinase
VSEDAKVRAAVASPQLLQPRYAVPAGSHAVLKIVPPEDVESDLEADALAFWNGDGAVRLLRHDARRKALLLERLRPGDDLVGLAEEAAIAAAIETGRRLWRDPPAGGPFQSVEELCQGWLRDVGPSQHEFLPRACAVLETIELKHRTLVHGDFQHHNILRSGSGWAAIDPKPAVGEPEYDIATFLWNPIESDPTPDRTARRIAAFAAAGLNPGRMRQWAIVRGTILGLPVRVGQPRPQLTVVRQLL